MLLHKLFADQKSYIQLSEARIMVLDDEKVILGLITDALRDVCGEVFSTEDENDFLQNLSSFAPNIVILDIMLKKTSGLELIPKIKKYNKNIQIIAISGQEDIHLITMALLQGATTFISKPFRQEILYKVINNILEKELERKATEKQKTAYQNKLTTLLDALPAAVFTVEKDYRYGEINLSFTRLTGRTKEELNNLNFWDVVHPEHRQAVKNAGLAMLENPGSQTMNNEFMFLTKTGEIRWANFSAKHLSQESGPALIASVFDITKEKQAEHKVRYVTNHDPLTGLYNRKYFINHIADRIKDYPENLFAVGNINIDRFNNINSLGEKLGDRVLKLAAARLRKFLGPEIFIARGSADDFFILYELSKDKNINFVKNDLQKNILEKVFDNSEDIYPSKVNASIGLSIYHLDATDPDELIKRSQQARRRARQEGGNRIKFFEPIDAESVKLQDMEVELQSALAHHEIFLMYQQQVNAEGQHIGMEALVRWNSKKYGIVSPEIFIPLAVSTGTINELGLWILAEACLKGMEWIKAGYDPGIISVNISPTQLCTEEIVEQIKEILEKTGFPAEKLKLEITETELADDNLKTNKIIHALQQKMGIKIAIDDFGAGQSHFFKLKDITVSTLKIDKSFIDNLVRDENTRKIVKAIIDMGHSLGSIVLAEGVETPEQFQLLKKLECDEFQGYLFSKPLFPEDLEDRFNKAELIDN